MTAIAPRLKLLISVIRDAAHYRPNNPNRQRADAEYKARRTSALERAQFRCVACGHVSKSFSECHHADGNHANNSDENLLCVDTLCHAYQHVGQKASADPFSADSLKGKTVVAAVPEVSAEGLNLMQRAIGAALLDPAEAPLARRIAKRLEQRYLPVRQAFGTFSTHDFAAAMVDMDQAAYDNRAAVVGDLRLLFSEDVLINEGRRFVQDHPALPLATWKDVARNAQAHAR